MITKFFRLILLMQLILPVASHAQSEVVSNGLNWLKVNQAADGSWSGTHSSSTDYYTTVSVLDSLAAFGETSSTAYTNGLSWARNILVEGTTYIAPRVRAVAASGADATIDLNTLLSWHNAGYGWGGDAGYSTSNFHTALGLLALKAVNHSDTTVAYSSLAYLTQSQNSDGGWGFTKDDESNIYVTAHVLSALSQFKSQYIMEQELKNAAAFLLSKQNPDGGFGSEGSTTYETALAFIALIECGHGNALALQNAVTYLGSTQLANGSWNDDPYSTALAVRALALVKPDLSIASSDVAALPFDPTVGDNITVTATVRNSGLETAANVTVRLLDNGVTAGELSVAELPPGGSAPAVFAVHVSPYGDHTFSIVIDPGNAIAETVESNNSASLRVWARTPADLVMMPEYIGISPAYPKPGETVTLTANIANMGETNSGAFDVDLYDGDPNYGGSKLGSFTIPGILPGQSGRGSVSFSLTTTGLHTLHLVVDPFSAIPETSKANNGAVKEVTVSASTGTGFTDFSIPAGGLAIDPPRPAAGETATVTLLAGNLSTENATAEVDIFDGDPAAGGVLIHRSSLNLNPAETRSISVPWQVPSGIHTLRAYIDRANLVAERDESNNSQSLTVMSDMVDIEVSASDISIAPEQPMDGDAATVNVVIQNRGIATTGAFNVALYNDDPESGGVLLQTFAVADMAGDATHTISYPFTAVRGTYRFYAVCDREDSVTELYEDNNLAIRSLLVKTSAEAKGPDLVPLAFDLSASTTDPQDLRIIGTAKVKFQNRGDDKVTTPFRITVFEDKDGDGIYSTGSDLSLGSWDYATAMNPSMVGTVTINLAGTVTFRDAPIYAMMDSGQAVYEQDKRNNSIRKGSACEARPATPIQPVVKWKWRTYQAPDPNYGGHVADNIYSSPVVMTIPDGQGGKKTLVLVISPNTESGYGYGHLHAFDGKTGQEVFSYYDRAHRFDYFTHMAVGDINNDGMPEIVIMKRYVFELICLNHKGELLWDNTNAAKEWEQQHPLNTPLHATAGYPVIADIDADGKPEIIAGTAIVNADGSIRSAAKSWRSYGVAYGTGSGNGVWNYPIVADIDLDGKQEIIAGNTVYDTTSAVKWLNPLLPDGINAIINADDDPYPEIVFTSHISQEKVKVYLLEHDGRIKWGPVYIADIDPSFYMLLGGMPVVADFDGDGQSEIGIKGFGKFIILDKDGRLKSTLDISPADYKNTAPTVFDLNGDGRPEVIFHSSKFLRIYDGASQTKLFETSFGVDERDNVYGDQKVIVADADGDGHAEIIAVGGATQLWPAFDSVEKGIIVFGAKNKDWVGTRGIWNQASYHVTNVNDDGTIPRFETPSWLSNNNYLCNVPTSTPGNPYLAADVSASFVRVDMANYPGSVTVTARIGNGGAKAVAPGVKAFFYDGDPANGGTLIGPAATTKPLERGQFEDLSLIWSAPAEGSHTITVIVDPDGTVAECDKVNNSASLQTLVAAGRPDPGIVAEDIVVPSLIPEGRLTDVAVTVRNLGTLRADNVQVRLYAGNPAADGRPIGTGMTIPAIAAGGTESVRFTWDTLAAQGTTYLYALVDPNAVTADVNRGNNTAFKPVTVSPSEKADLQIAAGDITISPAVPNEGDVLTITVNVHNRGIATGNAKVALYSGNPATGGRLVKTATIPQLIPLGGTVQTSFALDTIGLSGTVSLFVKLDPDNAIDESDEGNNQASGAVAIDPAGLTVGVVADKPSYGANEDASLTLSVAELKAQARTLACDLQVQDFNGAVAASIAAGIPVQVAAGSSITLPVTWNTGTTYSGAYTVVASFKDNGRIVAKASAPLAILPVKTAAAAIVVDKVSYNANEAVAITATVTGTSPNYIFTDLNATVTVTDNASGNVFTETRPVPMLNNGQRVEVKSYWNTGTLASGDYPVLLELKDASGAVIATGTTVVRISSIVKPSALLQGSVAVDKQSLFSGDTVSVSYTLKNVGNRDLASVGLSVITVNVGNETIYNRLTKDTSFAMGAEVTDSGVVDTAGYSAKDYLVILRASIDGVEETLAGTYFRVEGAPSAPALNAPAQGADVESLPVRLVVGNAADPNDDRLSYQFEVYSDSGLTTLVDSGTVPETSGSTAWSSSAALIENQTYFWRARAYDGILYGPWMAPASFRVNTVNDLPTAPTVSGPMDGSAVASLTPELIVGNSTDPDSAYLTYNFDVALDPEFTQVVASVRGISAGAASTSWTVPVSLQENGTYYWRAQADDWLVEGPWSATARFFVNTANEPPSVPVATSPIDGSTVASLATEVVAANSSDRDSPAISYFFEADTVPTFNSGNVIRSPGIGQGSGSTSWQLAGLSDNTRYYLRAKASDGSAESAWSAVTSFFANTANDAPTTPVLANPSSGAGVNVFAPLLSVHNASDLDWDALSYEFELYADAALTNLVARAEAIAETPSVTGWQVPLSLTENMTYYWRSRAFDGSLHGAWTTAAPFTVNTANDAPEAPKVFSPADGAGVEVPNPVLAVANATDPDSDTLTYHFELYEGGALVSASAAVAGDASGITSWTSGTPLADNTLYQWRARAHDGDSYGAWTDMASFTVHIPKTSITATVHFDPDTLSRTSKGTWVVAYIELPQSHGVTDIDLASVLLEGSIAAEAKPLAIGDQDKDGIADLMVKFRRGDLINMLEAGDKVPVHMTGTAGPMMFEGVDVIRVIK